MMKMMTMLSFAYPPSGCILTPILIARPSPRRIKHPVVIVRIVHAARTPSIRSIERLIEVSMPTPIPVSAPVSVTTPVAIATPISMTTSIPVATADLAPLVAVVVSIPTTHVVAKRLVHQAILGGDDTSKQ